MQNVEIIEQLISECGLVNSRLRECHAKIVQGYYENALELAERSPAVLAELTRVNAKISLLRAQDSPEIDAALDCNPSLQIDQAFLSSLQEAYDRVNQLKPLAQTLRQLVLSRAPAPSRLSVMREMLALDPSHPFLDEDIRRLERAWYAQVQDYCRRLAASGNKERISEVIEDLRSSGYVEPMPNVVVAGVKDAFRRSKLVAIEKDITAAHQAQDLAALEFKFNELQQVLAEGGPTDPGLEKRISAARQWMNERQMMNASTSETAAERVPLLPPPPRFPSTPRSNSSTPKIAAAGLVLLIAVSSIGFVIWKASRGDSGTHARENSGQQIVNETPVKPSQSEVVNQREPNGEVTHKNDQLAQQKPNEQAIKEKEASTKTQLEKLVAECSGMESKLLTHAADINAAEKTITNVGIQKDSLVRDAKAVGAFSSALSGCEADLNSSLSSLRTAIELCKEAEQLLQAVRKEGMSAPLLQKVFSIQESLAVKQKLDPLLSEVKQAYLTVDQLSSTEAKRQGIANATAEQVQQLPAILRSSLQAAKEELVRRDMRGKYREQFLRFIDRVELNPNVWIARFPETDEKFQNHDYFISDSKPTPGLSLPTLGGPKGPFPNVPKTEARLAPQVDFQSRARKLIESSKSAYALCDDLYADLVGDGDAALIDPILRVALVASLKQTIDSMSLAARKQLSTPQFKELDELASSLSTEITNRSWAQDQAYSEFTSKRARCEAVLRSLPRSLNLKQAAGGSDDAAALIASRPFHIVGVYAHTGSQNAVVMKSQTRPNLYATALVIDPQDASSAVEVKALNSDPKWAMLPVIGVFNKQPSE